MKKLGRHYLFTRVAGVIFIAYKNSWMRTIM